MWKVLIYGFTIAAHSRIQHNALRLRGKLAGKDSLKAVSQPFDLLLGERTAVKPHTDSHSSILTTPL